MKFKKTYSWHKIKTAKEALLWSIAKWHLLYKEGFIISIGSSTCACCSLYATKRSNYNCENCPVERYTALPDCIDTPFEQTDCAIAAQGEANYIKKCIKYERDFLIKVYNKYFDKFIIKEFENGPYNGMKQHLLLK